MENSSVKRHPSEKHSPGEEADRPHAARLGGSREKKVHRAHCSESATRKCAESKDTILRGGSKNPGDAKITLL